MNESCSLKCYSINSNETLMHTTMIFISPLYLCNEDDTRY